MREALLIFQELNIPAETNTCSNVKSLYKRLNNNTSPRYEPKVL